MCYLNGWHPFESIGFDLVKITMWRCLVLQIWEQQKQLLRKQRVIQSLQSLGYSIVYIYRDNRFGSIVNHRSTTTENGCAMCPLSAVTILTRIG